MRKTIFVIGLALISAMGWAQKSVAVHTLSNGMKVWLHEDHTTPKVFGAVVVKAGGIDCPGTGIAHYFEHIAFKGTDKIGTIDFEKEKPLLDSIEAYYNQLKLEKTDSARLEIQKKINRLSIESAKYVIPNELDNLLSTYGGAETNAYTSNDRTVYINSFSPQYVEQWCHLNSERMISPVFRLFQSELETVYEEKNMYANNFLEKTMERLLEIYYNDSPYAQPLIGTTESLKNPDMAAMRAYFEKYYTASNMSLLLAGDFDAQDVLPILEQTFGRIKKGEPIERKYTPSKEIKGRENFDLKVPIPLVRARAYGWKGITEANPDRLALRLATDILSNQSQTGYLDSLNSKGKLLFSGLVTMPSTHEGVLGAIVVPNLLGGSMKNAEKMVFDQLNRLKRGEVDPLFFESVKLTLKKEYDESIEDFDDRKNILIELMVNDKSWEGYLNEVELIDKISLDEVVAAANKYLNDNYYCITKTGGQYKKEEPLKKPPFDPIKPSNTGAKSAYAKELEKLPKGNATPKFIDPQQDAIKVDIAPLVKLYATTNNLNDIFSLVLNFGKGSRNDRRLAYVGEYLNDVGTDSLPIDAMNKELQKLGAEISFHSGPYNTSVVLRGYEKNFDKSLNLMVHYINNIAKDKKPIKQIISGKVMSDAVLKRECSSVAFALFQHVRYGDQSPLKTELKLGEVSKIKPEDYIAMFKDARKSECNITYFGKLTPSDVAKKLTEAYDFSEVKNPIVLENVPQLKSYSEPTVFFVDFPKATQASLYTYTVIDADSRIENQLLSDLVSYCVGRSMNSMIFQEIREFRSLAYSASGEMWVSEPKFKSDKGQFASYLSTQNDKTHEALAVLDSLYTNMEFDSLRLANAKRALINDIYQEYPSPRAMAYEVVDLVSNGYKDDPRKYSFDNADKVSGEELLKFYDEVLGDHKIVYIVVGNSKKIEMDSLSKYGKVVKLSISELKK